MQRKYIILTYIKHIVCVSKVFRINLDEQKSFYYVPYISSQSGYKFSLAIHIHTIV